jgi:predicted Fe-Mo cluster-binding NifX family protein
MRIAISSEENQGLGSRVSHHFGRCPYYILVDCDGEQIKTVAGIPNPFYQAHEPGMVPNFIHSQGVNVMISGGMGYRALDFFAQLGIEVATGAEDTVRATLARYFQGTLAGAKPCQESEEHRQAGMH